MSTGRRIFLALLSASALSSAFAAEVKAQVLDVLESMANGLSAGEWAPFVKALDPAMPHYEDLVDNVRGLVAQADVLAAIDILTETGDDTHQDLQLDWFLEITLRSDPMNLVRRRELVKCRLEKQKKKWRIVSLEPVSLFTPPKPRP